MWKVARGFTKLQLQVWGTEDMLDYHSHLHLTGYVVPQLHPSKRIASAGRLVAAAALPWGPKTTFSGAVFSTSYARRWQPQGSGCAPEVCPGHPPADRLIQGLSRCSTQAELGVSMSSVSLGEQPRDSPSQDLFLESAASSSSCSCLCLDSLGLFLAEGGQGPVLS